MTETHIGTKQEYQKQDLKKSKELKIYLTYTYKIMEKLSKLEILNEIIAYYNGDVNRRSKIESGDCAYNGIDGKHCGFGLCMLPEFKEQGNALKGNIGSILGLAESNKTTVDGLLEVKYTGHEIEFWVEIQELHDRNEFWDNAGLNAEGEAYTNTICKMFDLKTEINA